MGRFSHLVTKKKTRFSDLVPKKEPVPLSAPVDIDLPSEPATPYDRPGEFGADLSRPKEKDFDAPTTPQGPVPEGFTGFGYEKKPLIQDDYLKDTESKTDYKPFILTDEEASKVRELGKVTAGEVLSEAHGSELFPFAPQKAIKAGSLWLSTRRLQKDKYSDTTEGRQQKMSDQSTVRGYLRDLDYQNLRGQTLGAKVTGGVLELPAFIGEFLATGGLASLGKKAAVKAGLGAAKRGAAGKVIELAAGALPRTLAMPHRVAEGMFERMSPSGYRVTDKGRNIEMSGGKKPLEAFWKSFGDVYIENLSEESGELLMGALRKFVPKKILKTLDSIPKNTRINDAFRKAGVTGFLDEMSEERLGDFLRAVSGVEDFGTGKEGYAPGEIIDRVVASVPDGEQLLVEAGILAVPQLGRAVSSVVAGPEQIQQPVTIEGARPFEPDTPQEPTPEPVQQEEVPKFTGQILPEPETAQPATEESSQPSPEIAPEDAQEQDLPDNPEARKLYLAALDVGFKLPKGQKLPDGTKDFYVKREDFKKYDGPTEGRLASIINALEAGMGPPTYDQGLSGWAMVLSKKAQDAKAEHRDLIYLSILQKFSKVYLEPETYFDPLASLAQMYPDSGYEMFQTKNEFTGEVQSENVVNKVRKQFPEEYEKRYNNISDFIVDNIMSPKIFDKDVVDRIINPQYNDPEAGGEFGDAIASAVIQDITKDLRQNPNLFIDAAKAKAKQRLTELKANLSIPFKYEPPSALENFFGTDPKELQAQKLAQYKEDRQKWETEHNQIESLLGIGKQEPIAPDQEPLQATPEAAQGQVISPIGGVDPARAKELTLKQRMRESIKGPKEQPIVTASDALKYALKHEAKGSVKGYRQGQLDIRSDIKELNEFVQNNLPLSERGRLLSAIANVKTDKDRYQFINAVNRIQTNYDRRLAIKEFDKAKSKLDLKHLPPKTQKAVKFLFSDSARKATSKKLLQRMNLLAKYLENQEDPDVPDSLIKRMRETFDNASKVPFSKMSPDKIRLLTKTMENIVHQGRLKNALIGKAQQRSYESVKKDSIDAIEARHKTKRDIAAGKYTPRTRQTPLLRIATWDQTSMETKVEILGGDSVLKDVLYNDMQDGGRKASEINDRIDTDLSSIISQAGGIKTLKNLSPAYHRKPEKATKKLLQTIQLPSAVNQLGSRVKSIEILPSERMELYATWQDPSTRQKLSKNKQKGVTFANSINRPVKLFPDDVRAILGTMTSQEKQIADSLVELHNGWLQKEFDDAWVQEHGYSIVNPETTHWPRISDSEFKETDPIKIMQHFTKRQLDRLNIFKERTGGNNPLVIEDIFSKFSGYTNKVSAYIGKSAPSANAMRLIKDKNFKNTVRARIKHGDDLLQDMEKVISAYRGLDTAKNARFEKYARSWLNKMHVGVLGLKPYIMTYQPVSYLLASTEVDWKYLAHAPKGPNNKAIINDVNKYSPQLKARLSGSGGEIITPHSAGKSLRQRWTGKDSWWQRNQLRGIHKMDTMAIINIWSAAQAEQKAKGLIGEKLKEQTARRTEEIVNRTQPTWDVLTSSHLAVESKDSMIAKLATLFSSQRSKNMNMLIRAASEYNHSQKTAADKAKFANKVFTISIAQSALIYLIRYGWMGLLTGEFFDEEKKKKQNWIEHVFNITKRSLGNWLVIGDVAEGGLDIVHKVVTDTPYLGDRGNPLSNAIEELYFLTYNAAKAIKHASTDERYKGGKYSRMKKWPVDATRIIDGLPAVGVVTGLPIGGAMILSKVAIEKAKKDFIEEYGDKQDKEFVW